MVPAFCDVWFIPVYLLALLCKLHFSVILEEEEDHSQVIQ